MENETEGNENAAQLLASTTPEKKARKPYTRVVPREPTPRERKARASGSVSLYEEDRKRIAFLLNFHNTGYSELVRRLVLREYERAQVLLRTKENTNRKLQKFMLTYAPIIEAVEADEKLNEEHPLVEQMLEEAK